MSDEAVVSARDERLNDVLAVYIQAVEAGRSPDRKELLAQHPDLAADLGTFFADHDRMRGAAAPFRPAAETPAVNVADAETVAPDGPARPDGSVGRVPSFGDYELLEEVARGGMGVVFKARQVSLSRVVALKMILTGQFASPAEVQRFKSEAESAANLDHPNIVPIYEVGEHDGQHFFSMKLVEGGSLAALTGEPAASEETQRRAARLVATVARAVHYAHQRGVLHRDLKPANILLDDRGEPHITDFGLAKRVQGGSDLTQSGSISGTPGYMAPEQAAGRKGVSTAVDVYSLGAILYELLTGRPPFRADNAMETLLQVRDHEPDAPSKLNPHVDPDLEVICLKCLEKEPHRRYTGAEELAKDLERWLAGEPITARPAGTRERAVKWARRHPAAAALAGVSAASLLTLFVLAGFLWHNAELRAEAVQDLKAARRQQEDAQAQADEQRRQAREKRSEVERLRRLAEQAIDATREVIRSNLSEVERLRRLAEQEQASARQARETARRVLYAADMQFAHAAWVADDVPGMLAMLDRHKGKTGEENLRGFEWHYLRRLPEGARRSWRAHPEPRKGPAGGEDPMAEDPLTLAISRDGGMLASTRPGSTIKLWKLPSGEQVGSLPRPATALLGIAFSADGKRLQMVTVSAAGKKQGPIQPGEINDFVAGKAPPSLRRLVVPLELRTQDLDGKKSPVTEAFDPAKLPGSASFLTAGTEAYMLLVQCVFLIKDHLVSPLCLALSPDRKTLVIGGIITPVTFDPKKQKQEGAVVLWDLAGNQSPVLLKRFAGPVSGLAFSPDGKMLATVGLDNQVRLWEVATRKERATLKGHAALLLTVAFSSDGTLLASGAADGVIKLWDVGTGQARATLKGHHAGVSSLALTPDGKALAAGDVEGMVKLWDTTVPPGPARVAGFGNTVKALAFVEGGKRFVVADWGGTVTLCDAATGLKRNTAKLGVVYATSAAFAPDEHTVAVGSIEGGARVCDLMTGKTKLSLKVPTGLVYALAFSPDGKRLAGGVGARRKSGTVILWDAATGKELISLPAHSDHVKSVAFSPDGKTLASAGRDRSVKLWDAATGKELLSIKTAEKTVECIRFSPDGRLLACASGGTVTLYEAATGREALRIQGYSHQVVHMAFSPDGHRLATAGGEGALGKGGGVKLWDTRSGMEVLALGGTSDVVSCVGFSPDGRRLLAAAVTGSAFNFLAFPSAEVTIWDGTPLP